MRVKGYTHFNNNSDPDNLVTFFKKNLISEVDINRYEENIKSKDIIEAFISIESIAYVLKEAFPDANKIVAFKDILASRDLKVFQNLSQEQQRMIHALHVLFPEMRSRAILEKNLKIYRDTVYSEKHVLIKVEPFTFMEEGNFKWIRHQTGNRDNKYKEYLLLHIEHAKQESRYPKGDQLVINDDENRERYVIDLSDQRYKFVKFAKEGFTPISIQYEPKEKISITMDQLIETAREMDLLEGKSESLKSSKMHWEARVKDILFTYPQSDGLNPVTFIEIEGVQHWIGKLSVGKSTIIDIIAFMMAKTGRRTVIVLNSTHDVFRKVDYFSKLLDETESDILTVPLVSYKNRKNHVKDYMDSLTGEKNIMSNKSFYYLCTTCLLKGLDRAAETDYLDTNDYPCFRLQELSKNELEPNQDESSSKSIANPANYKTCPFITKCPYYNAFHDLRKAKIVITTPQSLVRVNIPKPFSNEKISFLEYLIRSADLFMIDEADRVQNTMDGAFVNEVTLLDEAGGCVNRIIAKLQNSLSRYGRLIYDEYVITWINDLHLASILLNRIGSFLSSISNREVIEKMKIKEKTNFSGFGLWLDLATIISRQVEKRDHIDDKRNQSEAEAIHDILVKYFEQFRQTFMQDDYTNLKSRELCEIAGNVTNEEKLKKDIDRFIHEEIDQIVDQELAKRKINKSRDSIYVDDNMNKWVYFIMALSLLELKLSHISERLPIILNLMPGAVSEEEALLDDIYKEFDGVIPSLPISIHYGFQYLDENGTPTLKLLKYSGVGRYVLYHLSDMYKVLDGCRGSHCILLSGTSYAPGSPKYNIDLPVKYLIKSAKTIESKISYSFLRTFSEKISGAPNDEIKKRNYQNVINKLSERANTFGSNRNQLEKILDGLEENRKRILLIVGSYRDSLMVSTMLNSALKEQGSSIRALPLKKNNNGEYDFQKYMLRQKVHKFAEKEEEILVAPLLAMERGHNILVDRILYEDMEMKVAAFGAAIFLVRPYYVPYDFSLLINRLNSVYLELVQNSNSESSAPMTLEVEVRRLKEKLYEEPARFRSSSYGYRALEDEERNRLLADTYVNAFQLEGRLIRGGVGAKVYFADSSFAPCTKDGTENDTKQTSMLLGWKYIWERVINHPESMEDNLKNTILNELYSIRLNGFKDINVAEGGR